MTDSKKSVSATLAAATCSLLGSAPTAPVQAQEEPSWDFNTALLYYGEDNDRVQDLSLNILGKRYFVDDRALTLGLTVDTLTGATPNGAIRQGVPQTFTRPSGSSAYTIPASELPLDDTFKDTRVALSAAWEQPLGRLWKTGVGFSGSFEYDYTHLGLNGSLSRDFNQRNTTVSAGLAVARDEWDPVGGTPIPFSPMLDVGDIGNKTGTETKDVIDAVLGVTQVISRNLLVQVNYSFSNSSGYLTDPYKFLSLVDGVTGDTITRVPAPGAEGPSHEFRFERRPDDRTKHSLYTQAKYYMGGKVLDASYRYMTDDWEIDSHTLDLRLRWPLGERSYVEPHLRFYTQSEADFYTISLVDGVELPAFASADYRLGNFDAITAGLKYGWKTRSGSEMSVRAELYRQSGTIPGELLIGNQVGRETYPDLDAIILQFSYQFGW
ncbi:MAG TPA: DUF3570 domain-containing protein [Woeseiaceae bacterium]|nr:DUF3570 domain-containing protein [Woeseiaceae bacterium]